MLTSDPTTASFKSPGPGRKNNTGASSSVKNVGGRICEAIISVKVPAPQQKEHLVDILSLQR